MPAHRDFYMDMTALDDKRKIISNGLFYIALSIELIVMILEKSEISLSYVSYVFRITFVLTILAVLIKKHRKEELCVMAVVIGITLVSYVLSGKNDLLRCAVFMMAARDIDIRKAVKYSFYVSIVGFVIIMLMSAFGIMGDIYNIADYGRGIADEKRYVLGFGHPNTMFGSFYVLVLMWLWLYGKTAGMLQYLFLTVFSGVSIALTRSRTGAIVLIITLIIAVLLRLMPSLAERKSMYIMEAVVSPLLCIVSAVLAGLYSEAGYTKKPFHVGEIFWKIDSMLSNRISSIYYEAKDHGAVLSNWKLFAGRGTDEYFDMGWNRLFYWYGIVPTILVAAIILAVIYICYKKKDIWTMLILLSVSVYTIVEATFVSRYIGRNFLLIIVGAYIGKWIYGRNENEMDAV